MRTIEQTFAAADTWRLVVPGYFFQILTGIGLDVEFLNSNAQVEKAEGVDAGYYGLPDGGFSSLVITVPSAQTVKIAISKGRGGYNRFSGDVTILGNPSVIITGQQGAYTRASIAAQDAVTATELFAANAARRYAFVQNNDGTKYLRLRVDGTAPTTSAGVRIPPGGYWESPAGFAPTGAIQVIAETAGGVAVEGLEG
jgi:hypothetical protein